MDWRFWLSNDQKTSLQSRETNLKKIQSGVLDDLEKTFEIEQSVIVVPPWEEDNSLEHWEDRLKDLDNPTVEPSFSDQLSSLEWMNYHNPKKGEDRWEIQNCWNDLVEDFYTHTDDEFWFFEARVKISYQPRLDTWKVIAVHRKKGNKKPDWKESISESVVKRINHEFNRLVGSLRYERGVAIRYMEIHQISYMESLGRGY